jgi:hypothetical protein
LPRYYRERRQLERKNPNNPTQESDIKQHSGHHQSLRSGIGHRLRDTAAPARSESISRATRATAATGAAAKCSSSVDCRTFIKDSESITEVSDAHQDSIP